MTSSKKIREKAQHNLARTKMERLFADEVIVLTTVKTHVRKEKKAEEVEKEGLVTLAFIDGINQQPLAKISLLPSTAEGLFKTLKKVTLNLRKELSKKERAPKEKKETIESDYIR